MKKHVTAKDIARFCGISQATVSYIINNRTDQKISEETRQKVLDAIEALHYYPNASARNMRTKNCTSIGIVCAKDYSQSAFFKAFSGISRHLAKQDYTITLFYEENIQDESDKPQYVKSYFSNLIDGLIYISNNEHEAFIQLAISYRIPYVVLCMDGVFSRKSPLPHSFDEALWECARFCRDRQIREIRYFSIDNDGFFANNKYPVFLSALAEIYPDSHLSHVVCVSKNRRLEEIQAFLSDYMEHNTFDLAISQNYDIGLTIQREILKKEFMLPQKTKNLLLNHVDFYEMIYPSVSGIYVPYTEMGEYAAELILAVIGGTEEQFQYRDFHCELMHRESTL